MTRVRYAAVAALLLAGVASGCSSFGNCNGNGFCSGQFFSRFRGPTAAPPCECFTDLYAGAPGAGAVVGGYPLAAVPVSGGGPTCLGDPGAAAPVFGTPPGMGVPPLAPAPRLTPQAQPTPADPVSRTK